MRTYTVKYGKHYIKFGSYSKGTLVDNPLKASLYSSEKLAKFRLKTCYLGNEQMKVLSGELKVSRLEMELITEEYCGD